MQAHWGQRETRPHTNANGETAGRVVLRTYGRQMRTEA